MFDNLSLLAMAKKRMDWVAQRQQVLARNVANADTPGYVPRDLQPLEFRTALSQAAAPVVLTATSPLHLAPPAQASRFDVETQATTYESAPNGNAVVLEEQMHKLGEAKGAYELAANLFQKHIRMLKTAIGRNG